MHCRTAPSSHTHSDARSCNPTTMLIMLLRTVWHPMQSIANLLLFKVLPNPQDLSQHRQLKILSQISTLAQASAGHTGLPVHLCRVENILGILIMSLPKQQLWQWPKVRQRTHQNMTQLEHAAIAVLAMSC